MSNKVLGWLERAGREAEIVVVDVATGAADAIRVLTSAQTLSPAFKSGIQTLIADAEAIATSSVAAGVSDGSNFLADAAVASQVEKLVSDFIKLLPVLQADAKILEADIVK